MVMVFYSEKTQIKISPGKRLVGTGPGEARCELPGVLPIGPFGQLFTLPTYMEYCQPGTPT